MELSLPATLFTASHWLCWLYRRKRVSSFSSVGFRDRCQLDLIQQNLFLFQKEAENLMLIAAGDQRRTTRWPLWPPTCCKWSHIFMQALPFPHRESPRTSVKLKFFSPQIGENKTLNTSWVHCSCRGPFRGDVTQPLTPQGKKNKAKVPEKTKPPHVIQDNLNPPQIWSQLHEY